MEQRHEKSTYELGVAMGQLEYLLNIQFLNFAMAGGAAKSTEVASLSAHAVAAAMGVGLDQAERGLAIVCHDELCKRIAAGLTLPVAVAEARRVEPAYSAFNALAEKIAINELGGEQ